MTRFRLSCSLTLASALTVLMWWRLDSHPLLPVLIVVPMAVVAFSVLDAWIVRSGGRLVEQSALVEPLMMLAMIFASLLGTGLGTYPHSVVVAGFVLVLAARTARAVVAAGSMLTAGSRPSLVFLAIPLLVYCCLLPWSASQRQPDGDEPYYLLVTHSLVEDFDLDLADDYQRGFERFMKRPLEPQIGDPVGANGEIYSRHSATVPLVLAPAYALGGRLGAMTMMATLAAVLAWQILRLALLFGIRPTAALSAYAAAAFTSPLVVYSSQVWAEVPAALLLAVALEQLLRAARGELTVRRVLILAAVIIVLPLLKLRFSALSASIVVVFLVRSRSSRSVSLAIVSALGLGFAALTGLNYLRSGSIFGIYSLPDLLLAGYTFGEGIRGLAGVLFDSAFGLLPAAPIWVLLLPAGWMLMTRHRRLTLDVLMIMAPYTFAICPRLEWYGGWSPPVRYFVVFLPFAALGLARVLHRLFGEAKADRGFVGSGARFVLGATVCLTVVLTVIWIVVPGWTYNFADGGNHLLDRYSQRLGLDLVRFFPSMVRLRLASFLWPLCLLAVVPLVLARRRSGPAPSKERIGAPRAAAAGALSVVLAMAVLLLAAKTVPTARVEAEDAHIVRGVRTELFPEQWIVQRTLYRGGLTLAEGGAFSAPVVPGGGAVEINLWVRSVGSGADPVLRLLSGEGSAGLSVPIRNGRWRRVRAGRLGWNAGESLVVISEDSDNQERRSVIVDRVDLEWSNEPVVGE